MATVRLPPLSPEATEFVRSILGTTGNTVDTSTLDARQVNELLIVLEAEFESADSAERSQSVSEFAAMLARCRVRL